MLRALIALLLSAGGVLAAQTPTPRKPSPPTTVRLYVFDCGMLTMTTEGVTRYHVTPNEVGETRMPVPCFLVAHPKGTLMWDVGVIPDAIVEKQASSGGARYDVNPTAAALVKRTLTEPARRGRLLASRHHLCLHFPRPQGPLGEPESLCVLDVARDASRARVHVEAGKRAC